MREGARGKGRTFLVLVAGTHSNFVSYIGTLTCHPIIFVLFLFALFFPLLTFITYIYSETKLAIHLGDKWLCVHLQKNTLKLEHQRGRWGLPAFPSQAADAPRAARCQAAFRLYPLRSCKRDREKHGMARKRWLNLKIISQGSRKKLPWLSISKFVKSSLIIKVKMAQIKTRLLCGLGLLPSPDLGSVPSRLLHFLFTPDLIFCTIEVSSPSCD